MTDQTPADPYAPSWVDRLFTWIESLPMPIWAFYLILYLISLIGLHLSAWFNGALPWGIPSVAQAYNAVWLPLVLFVIHNTDRVAQHALDRFAPLVHGNAAKLEAIRYEMTNMPARTVFWLSIIAVTVLLAGAIQDPTMVLYGAADGPNHPIAWALGALIGVGSYSLAPIMIYHSIRQLSLVTKAYELVDDIDIFHQQPLYAFSGLTIRTALFLVGLVYITSLGETLFVASSSETAINFALTIIILPLSLLIVLLPLLGIHRRLSEARGNVLEENSLQIADVRQSLYKEIKEKNYDVIQIWDGVMIGLYKERDQLKNIPTWPWSQGTFRNYLSAVILPMLIWILQEIFSRFLR